MPQFTAKDVQELRQSTGAGMMDAKKALTENDGDMDAAAQWLREQGLAASGTRADRENAEGCVAVVLDGTSAGLVELRCETDFVAKSPDFVALADELAALVAAKGADAVVERSSALDDLKVSLKENIELGRVEQVTAGAGQVIDTYLHVQNDRGVNAVAVVLTGDDRRLAHDVALHVASSRPKYLDRDEVPADVIAAERETLEQITRNEGKPEQAVPKIVEGRLNGFYKQVCLLDQPFVKDDKRSVAQVVGDSGVVAFAQIAVGS